MNHWAFVTAAYAVALLATGGLLLWAFTAMRRAERQAEQSRADR
ncbi:heme exporter protein CcmD [Sphingomonas sinipercae]|uniref:Heme exporter protein D n=1 Tax=Sphingomonas sinipercae TaxID=2714944 RepID=A0A6G7ZNQ0_9SPHN|nr:heme exporter protein CcmD [Sphingomonas sinipercae]QIL02555.1 heme exporter protein CcmD [Sphingomonas sinipercae]